MSIKYFVSEAEHVDPNIHDTMVLSTRKIHGPFKTKEQAEVIQKEVMMKNIDNYYHKAWIITKENHEVK